MPQRGPSSTSPPSFTSAARSSFCAVPAQSSYPTKSVFIYVDSRSSCCNAALHQHPPLHLRAQLILHFAPPRRNLHIRQSRSSSTAIAVLHAATRSFINISPFIYERKLVLHFAPPRCNLHIRQSRSSSTAIDVLHAATRPFIKYKARNNGRQDH